MLKCDRCGNEDVRLFGIREDGVYCRKCITFNGNEVSQVFRDVSSYEYELNYKLSKDQTRISKKVLSAFINKKDVLIHAVCGAGKTELVFETISYALSKKYRVGFAIPRKDVVIDLLPRFIEVFKNNVITAVYGGNTSMLGGDLVILTTHQLYRYSNYFDLLILDETDAFPYQGNDVLNKMFFNSLKGNYVMLSATPNDEMVDVLTKRGGVYLKLLKRYHKYPIPVPKVIITILEPYPFFLIKFREYYLSNDPVLVFVPTIDEGKRLFDKMKYLFKEGEFVYSNKRNKNEIVDSFKKGKYKYLITTSILERGITIKDLQVIVYNSDHELFKKSNLIQIAGRVGRKIDSTCGDVLFIAREETEDMRDAIDEINRCNRE